MQQVTKVLQDEADEDNNEIQAWSSMFEGHLKSVYPASEDLINIGSEFILSSPIKMWVALKYFHIS